MAEPTFQIHRIWREPDGKCFACQPFYCQHAYFSNEGAFFRKMETIRRHLRNLIKEGYSADELHVETFKVAANTRSTLCARQVLGL